MLKRQHLTGVLVLLSLVAGTAMASAQTPAYQYPYSPYAYQSRMGRIMPRRLQQGITPRHLRGTATTIRGPGIPGTATIKEVLAHLKAASKNRRAKDRSPIVLIRVWAAGE
jgi:hypothetical protein